MNSALQYSVSPYAHFMQETKVDLGNGIQLHVEIGGNPDHPSVLLIMGLGAQMLFWPVIKSFVLITETLVFPLKSVIKVHG